MKKLLTGLAGMILIAVMLFTAACAAGMPVDTTHDTIIPQSTTYTATTPAVTTPSTGNIGLAAGGAKDIANFRENINNGYLPLPSDVTYEGLFYDYYFDTGANEPAQKLYSPAYSTAVSRDPLSGQIEYYLAVGLNSGLKKSDFQRKKLELAIVIDNSGSMNENYDRYYYDGNGVQVDAWAEDDGPVNQKINSAAAAVVGILSQLNAEDRLAIVTFNSTASLLRPLSSISEMDIEALAGSVNDIIAGGSTNLEAGLALAGAQFADSGDLNPDEYEKRLIVITDAQPNTGDISSLNLLHNLQNNADGQIYTTFIGVGVDFNSDLIERISKIKGCNYYSVHSAVQFRERIDNEFEYMVTPLVFDLELQFQSEGWRIEKVFGSPLADADGGRLMQMDTLFAAASDAAGQVKGGLVLLKLQKTSSPAASIYLSTTYTDRYGRTDGDMAEVSFENLEPESFENSGIRKGVLLTRYAALLKNWLIDERQHYDSYTEWEPVIGAETGLRLPDEYYRQWERRSIALKVSPGYAALFQIFAEYFESEMQAIGDYKLEQERQVLTTLMQY
jgi:Ca-activated chloride channel family protein